MDDSIPSASPPLPPVLPPPELPPPDVVKQRRWRWWVHLAIFILFPLLVLVSAVPGLESTGPALTRSSRGLLLVSAFELFFFGLFFGLAWTFSRATSDDLLLRWRGGFWPIPLAVIYSIGLRFAVGIIVMIGSSLMAVFLALRGADPQVMEKFVIRNRPQVETLVDVAALRDNPAYFWLAVTLVSFVVAGLREELWRSAFLAGLRAIGPRRFGSRAGQILAAGVAALFFGIGHLRMGLLAVVMTAFLGFGFGVIMVLHRSIWPAVIAHGMFNAATFAFLPWLAVKLHELQKSLGP
jgi:membrane protease YdiL (CAAX protease family)